MSSELNLNSVVVAVENSEETRRNEVYEEARVFVLSLCLFGFVLLISISLLQIGEFIETRKYFALIPIVFVEGLFFYLKVYHFIAIFEKFVGYEILTSFFDVSTWIAILIYCNSTNFSPFFVMIPLTLGIITKCLKYNNDSSALKIFELVIPKQYKIIFKCVGFLIIFNIGLDIEFNIDMTWHFILWPIWLTLFALSLKSLLMLAYIICGLAYTESASTEKNKLILVIWTCYSTLFCAFSFAITIFFAVNHICKLAYLPAIIFLIFFELLTLIIFKAVTEFITDCFFTPNHTQNLDVPNSGQGNVNENQEVSPRSNFKLMEKINSFYYKPVEGRDLLPVAEIELNKCIRTKSCENFMDEEENEKGKESCPEENKCLLCMDLICTMVIIPCGHGGICHKCAKKLAKNNKPCHICRGTIEKIIKIREIQSKYIKIESRKKK